MSRTLGRAPSGRTFTLSRQTRASRPTSSRAGSGAQPIRVRADGRFHAARKLDPDAVKVLRRLNAHGFTAYLVGGCVRDLMLDHEPKDFDIATDATPRQVKRLFRNSRIIGRRFRLVHVTFQDKVLDVSTFRAQVEPDDHDDPMIRHDNVFGTAGEDARRRDFTINGLFYDIRSGELIDYVGGLRDLERGVIETIGDPWVRFREDPVRMLRAIKFAGRLDFRLADDVFQAMLDLKEDLKKAAAPRIFEEIVRVLNRGGALQSVRLLYKTGIMSLLLPEVADRLDAVVAEGGQSPVWKYLKSVDERVKGGRPVTHVVMLACLFLDLFDDALYDEDGPSGIRDLNLLTERILRPISSRLHMSRRDVYRLKQILVAQRRLCGFGKSRRRRGSVTQFMNREYFREALQLFRIVCETRGLFPEELAEWNERMR